jgi:hypothetical protein
MGQVGCSVSEPEASEIVQHVVLGDLMEADFQARLIDRLIHVGLGPLMRRFQPMCITSPKATATSKAGSKVSQNRNQLQAFLRTGGAGAADGGGAAGTEVIAATGRGAAGATGSGEADGTASGRANPDLGVTVGGGATGSGEAAWTASGRANPDLGVGVGSGATGIGEADWTASGWGGLGTGAAAGV